MVPKNIPDDINVEVILPYFPEGMCKVLFKGLHKRNSYCDLLDIEEKKDGSLLLSVGRNSLYNMLPEYMFHPIDRFDNIPVNEAKKMYTEEIEKQEKEKEKAYKFFAPIDLLLLKLRTDIREKMRNLIEGNKVLIDILADRLTEEQMSNRFIKKSLPFMPSCKHIRGDKTLLTLLLRKIFLDEGINIEIHIKCKTFTDNHPRYEDSLGCEIGDGFVGNKYEESVIQYDVHYWSDDDCDENFLTFVNEVEPFRLFIQDYFMSVEEILIFDISKDEAPLRLSDEIVYNYLNYNTNI